MNDFMSATLLSLEEKIKMLDNNDRRLLDEMANHLLMTHELLQNRRDCGRQFSQAPGYWAEAVENPDYLGNHN